MVAGPPRTFGSQRMVFHVNVKLSLSFCISMPLRKTPWPATTTCGRPSEYARIRDIGRCQPAFMLTVTVNIATVFGEFREPMQPRSVRP